MKLIDLNNLKLMLNNSKVNYQDYYDGFYSDEKFRKVEYDECKLLLETLIGNITGAIAIVETIMSKEEAMKKRDTKKL